MQAIFETQGRGLEQSGILVLDKPQGLSSARVVGRIKKIFGARKVGHAGTLDPFATGVLVCMLNQATRLGRFLLVGDKSYEAVLHLGIETDSQDSTGKVIGRHPVQRDMDERLADAFGLFEGEIEQRPPVFSALKHKGVPLYKWARQGMPVQKPARRVTIKALQVKAVEGPKVHFRVTCSAGTYIRSLCADVGRVLGCGGHLSRLRRIASSGFAIEDALGLAELETRMRENKHLLPLISPAAALKGMPKIVADETATAKINHGVRLTANDLQLPDRPTGVVRGRGAAPYCKVVDTRERLLAVVRYQAHKQLFDYSCVFPPTNS